MSEFGEIIGNIFRRSKQPPQQEINIEPSKFPMKVNDAFFIKIGTVWRGTNRNLSDGKTVRSGEKLGVIMFSPKYKEGESTLNYILRARRQTIEGLHTLAKLVQEDKDLKNIKVFGGYTKINKKLLRKFGFGVFDIMDIEIIDPYKETINTLNSWSIEGNTSLGKKYDKDVLPVEALISREKLIKMYGEPQSTQDTQTKPA